jgi:hypothetical protein
MAELPKSTISNDMNTVNHPDPLNVSTLPAKTEIPVIQEPVISSSYVQPTSLPVVNQTRLRPSYIVPLPLPTAPVTTKILPASSVAPVDYGRISYAGVQDFRQIPGVKYGKPRRTYVRHVKHVIEVPKEIIEIPYEQPYEVVKKVEYPVQVPQYIDKVVDKQEPYEVKVPYPVDKIVEKRIEVPKIKEVKVEIKVPQYYDKVVIVQLLSHVQIVPTPWTVVSQDFLFFRTSQSLLKLMSIESMMPSSHLILCRSLFLLPSIFLSIRVFSNESGLCIRWPKYWSFCFSISPSSKYSGLISFKIDGLDLQGSSWRVLSSTTVRKHQLVGALPSLWPSSHI